MKKRNETKNAESDFAFSVRSYLTDLFMARSQKNRRLIGLLIYSVYLTVSMKLSLVRLL